MGGVSKEMLKDFMVSGGYTKAYSKSRPIVVSDIVVIIKREHGVKVRGGLRIGENKNL